MRPSPDEVIAGVRAILKQDVAAALPAAAQPQLRRVMAVLRDGRWNEAGFDLLRENAAFAQLARDCAVRLDRECALPALLSALSGTLRDAADHGVPTSFAAANTINRELRDALSRCMDAVRDTRFVALDDMCGSIGAMLLSLRAA